jgi:hypothetical protein
MLKGDSAVALVTFRLDTQDYKSSLLLDHPLAGFASRTTLGDIDKATTVLIVDVDEEEFPGDIRYKFEPSEIVFKTANPQFLYLPLVCYDQKAGTASPRFHLYDMSTQAKVVSAEHLSGTNWLPISPFSVFPPGAYQARITFDMPQIQDKRYKLNIGVWDTEANKRADCDPLVGNDPP